MRDVAAGVSWKGEEIALYIYLEFLGSRSHVEGVGSPYIDSSCMASHDVCLCATAMVCPYDIETDAHTCYLV